MDNGADFAAASHPEWECPSSPVLMSVDVLTSEAKMLIYDTSELMIMRINPLTRVACAMTEQSYQVSLNVLDTCHVCMILARHAVHHEASPL